MGLGIAPWHELAIHPNPAIAIGHGHDFFS
jgi:hypothetical protein